MATEHKKSKFKLALPLVGKVTWSFIWRYCTYLIVVGVIEGIIWVLVANSGNKHILDTYSSLVSIFLVVLLLAAFPVALKKAIETNMAQLRDAFDSSN